METRPLSVSERGKSTPESPIRKLAPYAEAAKKKGVKIYHLNIGQPDIHTPHEFYDALTTVDNRVLAYGPSNGLPQFRESLVHYYQNCGYEVDGQHIMVTTAGSEAVVFAMMAVASPGEEIITFEPFYPNYNGFSKMAGVNLVPVTTNPETGYHLPSADAIEAKITSKTRAILICTPNNPTGTVLSRKEMSQLADLAMKHNLFILSDEVYREFIFDGEHTSVMNFPELKDHAIMMDSLSKRYSACGARVGCIVSRNPDVMNTVLKFGQARLCPPTLEQIASTAVVNTGDKYFQPMVDEYRIRRDTLYNELMKIPGVKCKEPKGAFYMMVTFPVDDIEDFCRWLLTDFQLDGHTTMLAPGPGFYASPNMGKQEARIAYVLNADDMRRAIQIIGKGLEAYNG